MSNNGGSGGPPYGWALIGCGSAGSGHARGAAETPEVEVRGFCDVVPESAERLQGEYGGYVTSDPQRIFDDPSVDIVSIATPHSMHTEPALAAIAAGKHLWLEKPMAMSTAECLQIAAAQRAAGTQLMLNFSFRFSGAVREAKRRLGRPLVSHAQCLMAPADLNRWRWDPVIGGGPLWDIGVHMVDLLCWFHEAAPVEVYATGGQLTHREALAGTDIVDTTAATLRLRTAPWRRCWRRMPTSTPLSRSGSSNCTGQGSRQCSTTTAGRWPTAALATRGRWKPCRRRPSRGCRI